MDRFEAILRAASSAMGGDPELWRGLLPLTLTLLPAIYAALPADVAEGLRQHLES